MCDKNLKSARASQLCRRLEQVIKKVHEQERGSTCLVNTAENYSVGLFICLTTENCNDSHSIHV